MKQYTSRELSDWLREERKYSYAFSEGNLPDPSCYRFPQVNMMKEDIIRFRNDYTALLVFAGEVLGKDFRKLNPWDLCEFLLNKRFSERTL